MAAGMAAASSLLCEYFNGISVYHVQRFGRVVVIDPTSVKSKPLSGMCHLCPVTEGGYELSEFLISFDLELNNLSILSDHFEIELFTIISSSSSVCACHS